MAVILPGLANSTARSDRVLCVNNLRQIGIAYANVGLDLPGGSAPWLVFMTEGGNNNHPLKQNLYVQFSLLSNHLATPRLLADPGDNRPSLRPARHWGTSSGGLWNPIHQNNAVSYFLGLDGTFRIPRAVLSGDRNLATQTSIGSCPGGTEPCAEVQTSTTRWTNEVHGLTGNLLFYDGSVEQTETEGLRKAFRNGAGLPASGAVDRSRVMMTFY